MSFSNVLAGDRNFPDSFRITPSGNNMSAPQPAAASQLSSISATRVPGGRRHDRQLSCRRTDHCPRVFLHGTPRA
jgi:hypothetical protein